MSRFCHILESHYQPRFSEITKLNLYLSCYIDFEFKLEKGCLSCWSEGVEKSTAPYNMFCGLKEGSCETTNSRENFTKIMQVRDDILVVCSHDEKLITC